MILHIPSAQKACFEQDYVNETLRLYSNTGFWKKQTKMHFVRFSATVKMTVIYYYLAS